MLRFSLRRLPQGVLFAKAMGCGKGIAFSIMPDWARYAVILECCDAEAEKHLLELPQFKSLERAAREHRRIELAAFRKHGAWTGNDPFALQATEADSGRVAVLTRATIALNRIPHFIRLSRTATAALINAPGLEFSFGMGEYPLTHQATFSIWENDAAMAAYAYKDVRHIAAMKEKAAKRIFKEEMFVRFRVLSDTVIVSP